MEQPDSRRLLGVAAVIVVGLLADFLPSGPTPTHLLLGEQYLFFPTVWDSLATIAILAVGGFVSRSRFVPIAATLAVLSWMVAQYLLNEVAVVAGQADIAGIAIGNIPSFIMVLAASVVGAYFGEQIYSRKLSATLPAAEG